MEPVFTTDEIRRLERTHPDGLPATTLVELLAERGIDLAEATFRRYVQLGLLPRSRRVGRKGKHRGSHGLYPVACVGQVAEIRRLMEAGLTLQELKTSAVALGLEVDALRRAADAVLDRLDEEAAARGRSAAARRLQSLRVQAEQFAAALEKATRELCPPEPLGREALDAGDAARQARASKKALPRKAAAVPKQNRTTAAKVSRRLPGVRPEQGR